MEIKDIIDILIDVSKKKEAASKKLLDFTIAQEGFIKEGDLDKLATVIEQKQGIIEKIKQMDIDFLTNYNRLKKSLGVASIEEMNVNMYPSLKQLKLHVHNIMTVLGQIDEIDKRNTNHLKIDFEKVKIDMKNLKAKQQSSKISSTYMKKYAGVQGVFIDNK